MRSRVFALVLLALAIAGGILVACGGEEAPAIDTTPIVGLMEIPISRNHQAPEPTQALEIEVSPTELRLAHSKVLDLSSGRPAESEISNHTLTKLRSAISSGAARARARLTVHSMVPYVTFVQLLNTLRAAGLREAVFAVRQIGETPTAGWMSLANFEVIPAGDDIVELPASFRQLPWSAFTEHWQEVYDACRAGQYIDCDGPYASTAQGGNVQIVMYTSGQGMKVSFYQTQAPEAEAPAGGGGGPALIEGLAPRPAPAEGAEGEEPVVPATEGHFNVRSADATTADSAISNLMRPVCGAQTCPVVFDADSITPSMRALSFLGAAFPNGASPPQILFRLPRR